MFGGGPPPNGMFPLDDVGLPSPLESANVAGPGSFGRGRLASGGDPPRLFVVGGGGGDPGLFCPTPPGPGGMNGCRPCGPNLLTKQAKKERGNRHYISI